MQGAKKGVLGLLEVIHTDFSRLETDTDAAEIQAALLPASAPDLEPLRLTPTRRASACSAEKRIACSWVRVVVAAAAPAGCSACPTASKVSTA